MVTIIDSGKLVNNDTPANPRCACMVGLSTDSKPTTGVGNGWMFIEMNTGKVYLFNEAGSAWIEWGA